ncbi:MAG: tRNA pseudouridine(55) synthase TruB [Treponema sp.]|jgi:tRNA pseudouridine55 synthase|nr:tRNA pseudouridine(55) synthase TruB [Treponema sp.]
MTKPIEVAGLLLLNKPAGLTSFTSLNRVKRAFSTGKVGHTGTLDKFAQGLLVALLGRAVKLTPWFSGCDKWYEGIIRLGLETDTLDPEGAPVAAAELPTREQLEAALPAFRGDILQEPPVYSALHIDGKRASALARSGETVSMRKRPVSIYALELLEYEPPLAHIRVHCSSGTYIRSLARDIALAAASRGHLVSLTRTAIAGFCLSDALVDDEPASLQAAIRPIDTRVFAALKIPVLTVNDETARNMTQGKRLEGFNANLNGDTLAVFRQDNSFVGIIERTSDTWRYGYMWSV